jgi:hypothetical protein
MQLGQRCVICHERYSRTLTAELPAWGLTPAAAAAAIIAVIQTGKLHLAACHTDFGPLKLVHQVLNACLQNINLTVAHGKNKTPPTN